MTARIKVHELRQKSKVDLLNQLKELKAELALLRVAKVTGGAPNKLSKMYTFSLSVSRSLAHCSCLYICLVRLFITLIVLVYAFELLFCVVLRSG